MNAHLLMAALLIGGCSEPQVEDPSHVDDWVLLETGKGCAKAKVACGPGNCAANVDNTCRTPITCELRMESICRAYTGEEGPATATSGDQTILSGNKHGLAAHVICDAGEVLATIARKINCF